MKRRIDELAEAILDGAPVDWAAIEAAAEGSETLVQQLRVLAAIAEVHRRAGESDGEAHVEQRATAATAAEGGESWGALGLLDKVGEGSFAEVYRAWDARLDRQVALKLLRRADPGSSMVVEEGRMLARVRHPNVVAVHGADRIDGRVGLWMEFIHGRTLEEILRQQGPFGVQEAAIIGLDLCRALSAVHRAGLLHRDVKAQNVMREEGGRIVLMDFGSGHAPAAGDDPALQLAGTPLYLAPEVLGGAAPTPRADIYALGVLLYHLVTASYPVSGRSVQEVIERQQRNERTLLRDARPELPERFVRVVERALAPRPEDRFESAGAMEAALAETIGAPAPVPEAGVSARRRGLRAATVVLGLAAVGALGFLLGRRTTAPPSPPLTRLHRLTDFVGLEEFPAVSPDGKSVAFTSYVGQKRQLFVRMIAGGPPLQLTRDDVDHQWPRWTPDASSLVYFEPPAPGQMQGTLWEIPALGGPPRRLGNSLGGADVGVADGKLAYFRLTGQRVDLVVAPRGGAGARVVTRLVPGSYYRHPRCSPDGGWIAFERGDGVRSDVFVVSASGGEPRRWTHDETATSGFSWLPDSRRIVLSSSRGSTLPYLPTFGLWELALDEEQPRVLTRGEASLVEPDVNRSGTMVAGRERTSFDLWRFPAGGDPRANVREGLQLTRQTGYVQTPTTSPDDAEVAFLSDSGGHTNLWAMRNATGELRQLTYETDPSVAVGVPVWSPRGGAIAFVSSRGNPGLDFGVWVVRPDGSDMRQLVKRGLGAAWSADGSWLYYVELPAGTLKKIAPGGGTPRLVTRERTRNVIGAHGATLYYTVERPLLDGRPEFEIRAATPEGAPSRLLARIPASRVGSWQILNPALSSDGQWLAQPLIDGFTTNLWALSTTTGEWRQLTDFGARATLIARRVSWSADGRHVYASLGEADADVVLLEPARQSR